MSATKAFVSAYAVRIQLSYICTLFSALQAYTNYIRQFYHRQILSSYSSVDDDSSLLGHDALSVGE
jgi:hypothetical protein